jgi:putative membrane protein
MHPFCHGRTRTFLHHACLRNASPPAIDPVAIRFLYCVQFIYVQFKCRLPTDLTMQTTANVLTALIAALHIYILLLEMFWWTTARGRRAFGTTVEFAESTRVLAANQGLYNGFLAAGLIWGLALGPAGNDVKVFFLGCVAIAGLYGGLTASRKILFIQALPGVLGLTAVLLA